MSGPQVPALAVQAVNDVFPGTVPKIPGPGLSLFSRSDGAAAFWDTASAGGLPRQFFIDPTIAQDNAPRFKTIQAAINYAVANLFPSGVVQLAPGFTFSENVTLPTSGTWEICSAGEVKSTISGNIICNNAGGANYTFSRIEIDGNILGAKSGATTSRVRFFDVFHNGSDTLTVSGSGEWFIELGGRGGNFNGESGYTNNAISVTGRILCDNWSFFGNVTYTGQSRFNFCVINAGVTLTANGLAANTVMIACPFGGSSAIVGVGSPAFSVDGFTLATMGISTGQTTVSGVLLKTVNANGSIEIPNSAPANLASQFLMFGAAGIYTARAIAHLITSGGTGTLLIDVNYIDARGNAKTLAITSTGLVLSGTAGTEDGATTRAFYHDGSAAITATIKGVTGAGSTVRIGIACRREN